MSIQITAAFPTVHIDGIEGLGGDSWTNGRGKTKVLSWDLAPPNVSTGKAHNTIEYNVKCQKPQES